jgi:hypothetical protein
MTLSPFPPRPRPIGPLSYSVALNPARRGGTGKVASSLWFPGQAVHFDALEELLAFVIRVLTEVEGPQAEENT